MAKKEEMKVVKKTWGCEIWVVNCPEYCGKFLFLRKGAQSSYHYHIKKKETFYCLEGQVALAINDISYMLNPYSRPKTIDPGERHSFQGITEALILEISTHHDDGDVVRLTQSTA
jgi:quercetin dioxygenase-like cupin family protein